MKKEMRTKMKIKPLYIVVAVLIVLSGALAYDVFSSYLSPYMSVSQVAGNDRYLNKKVQILDTVVNGSTSWGEDGSLSFKITDGRATINVTYRKPVPQGFKEGLKVVVIGTLDSPYHVNASQLLVKCPSKYE